MVIGRLSCFLGVLGSVFSILEDSDLPTSIFLKKGSMVLLPLIAQRFSGSIDSEKIVWKLGTVRLREVAHFSRAPSSEENTGTANERSQAEGGARPKIDTVGWNTTPKGTLGVCFCSFSAWRIHFAYSVVTKRWSDAIRLSGCAEFYGFVFCVSHNFWQKESTMAISCHFLAMKMLVRDFYHHSWTVPTTGCLPGDERNSKQGDWKSSVTCRCPTQRRLLSDCQSQPTTNDTCSIQFHWLGWETQARRMQSWPPG